MSIIATPQTAGCACGKRGPFMETEHLREFIELARDGSFTKTASRLNLAQSTLSKHVAMLEEYFGARVFERNNLRTVLTPAGRILLDDAQEVLTALDNARQHLESYRHSAPLTLQLELFRGYKPTDDLVVTAQEELRRDGRLVDVEAIDIVKPPLDQLRSGAVDLGLFVYPEGADLTGMTSIPLVTEPLVAVVSREHPLAARDTIRASELTGNVVWTIQEEGSVQFARRVEQLLLEHGARPRFVPVPWQNGQNSYTRIAFVDSGVFVHFASVAKFSMPVTSSRHKVLRFEDPNMEITVSAVWREEDHNEARELLVAKMQEVAAEADMGLYWR